MFAASFDERVDRMKVPGATTSGFTRLSAVGPRLLNATTWSGRFAIGAFLTGLAGKSDGHQSP